MHLSKLSRSEWIAVAGGLMLLVGIFLPWYVPNTENRNAIVAGSREAVSAWETYGLLRFLLLAAAIAPLILAWVIIRDHQLSWPRGEMTAVVGMIAIVLVLYVGFVDRPGNPSGQISLKLGWFIAVVGCALIVTGGAMRAGSTERPRKPPGVL